MKSRSITGLVLAALLALPATAKAQSQGSGVWLGALGGAEWGDASGYQLRGDAEVPITRPSTKMLVSGVLSVSYSGLEHDLSVFELVPAARLGWTLSQQFGAYADVGLGYAHASANGHGVSGSTMRIGAGATYALSSKARFVVELAAHPHWGDYDQTTTTLMLGAKFRI